MKLIDLTGPQCELESKVTATASLIENWIDEAERRTWFLFEASRRT